MIRLATRASLRSQVETWSIVAGDQPMVLLILARGIGRRAWLRLLNEHQPRGRVRIAAAVRDSSRTCRSSAGASRTGPPFAVGSSANGGMPSAASADTAGHVPRSARRRSASSSPSCSSRNIRCSIAGRSWIERLERQEMARARRRVPERRAVGRQIHPHADHDQPCRRAPRWQAPSRARRRPHLDAANGVGGGRSCQRAGAGPSAPPA